MRSFKSNQMDPTNKPFLQLVTKVGDENQPIYSYKLCGIIFRGCYHRVVAHFDIIGKTNHGIPKCQCSVEQLNEMLQTVNQRQL